MATVMDPDVRHAGYPSCEAQEVFARAAVLVCDQEGLIGCIALWEEEEKHAEGPPEKVSSP